MSASDTESWLPRAGDRIDRYELIAPIARGGMAAVYAVRRRSIGGFGKLLAMKILLPHLRRERQFTDMFLDEARIASAIEHPNVVQVFDLGEEQGAPFLVMELVRGLSLSELGKRALGSETPIPAAIALQILAEAAEGLHAAHETTGADAKPLGIVHRDVSPHNILVSYDGHAKVSDFGIAAARGRIASTRSGEVRGKLCYLAPEQIQRLHSVDRRADVWALGVVAYELLCGERLFDASDEAAVLWEIVNGRPPPLVSGALPEAVVHSVRACLERDREKRPASCRQLAEVFSDAARALGCRGHADVERFIAELCPNSELRLDRALADPVTAALKPKEIAGSEPAEPAEPTEQTRTDAGVSASFAAPARSRSKRWVALVLAALGAVAALLVVTMRADDGSEEARARPSAETPAQTAPAPSASTAAAEPLPESEQKRRVRLDVAPDVARVIVGNSVHAERPVTLELGPGESIELELVSKSGKVTRQSVSDADDGKTLGAAERPRPRPPGPGKKPLLPSPYD